MQPASILWVKGQVDYSVSTRTRVERGDPCRQYQGSLGAVTSREKENVWLHRVSLLGTEVNGAKGANAAYGSGWGLSTFIPDLRRVLELEVMASSLHPPTQLLHTS